MENKIFSKKVLEKAKELGMKPKSHFIIKTVLFALGMVFFLLFTLFLMSFMSFALRINAFWNLPKFGLPGLGMFFIGLPWILIFVSLTLIMLLYFFSKRFSFVYKKSVIYFLVVIIAIVLLSGFAVSKTGFHRELFDRAQKGHLPVMGTFYRNYSQRGPKEVSQGTVLDIERNIIFFKDIKGNEYQVIIASSTKRSILRPGDMILVYGKKDNETIWAKKILKMK